MSAKSMTELREIQAWSREHALELAADSLEKLANYLNILRIWSPRAALIGASEQPLLVRKHVADSLFAAAHCPQAGRAADLGSGAGLPGIPVALARPGLQVDLVESRTKKASFLTDATRQIANAHVVNKRIEDLAGADYDIALARALAPLDRLLLLSRPVLRKDGVLLAMKARSFEEELAAAKPGEAGFTLEETTEYQLPTGEQRVLLRFRAE